jgi:hypothetical protein
VGEGEECVERKNNSSIEDEIKIENSGGSRDQQSVQQAISGREGKKVKTAK